MLDPRVIDPGQEVVHYDGLDDEEITQIVRVLAAVRHLREAEQEVSARSRTAMRLNETDMRALRFLVAAKNRGQTVTPGMLSEHLEISTASTTKMLDRLADAGHIQRLPHPTDRRAVMITIVDRTRERVRDTVGRTHARRFEAAARLAPGERETVIRFLDDLAGELVVAEAEAEARLSEVDPETAPPALTPEEPAPRRPAPNE